VRDIVCINDFERMARRALPGVLYDYIDGGSFAEVTKSRNVEDWAAVCLEQRVMRDVSKIDTSVEVLGSVYSLPLGLSPVGLAGMFAKRGEVQAAMAALDQHVPFCLSTLSICSVAEVAAKTAAPPWFQLYMLRDKKIVQALLERAGAAGVDVLVLTVDLPVVSVRYRDHRSGLGRKVPIQAQVKRIAGLLPKLRWLVDVAVKGRPLGFGNLENVLRGVKSSDVGAWVDRNLDASVTWKEVEWVKQRWPGKVLIKGIMSPLDADEAIKVGADAIIVSNHGGRQLDGVPSTAKALPEIACRVGGSVPILVDGGIRSGLDVVRALSLGANFCMIGRPWAFAVASGGHSGVMKAIDILRTELSVAMALCGFSKTSEIAGSALSRHRNLE
jgi:L-lactate dehydrogenase (cytochrome)